MKKFSEISESTWGGILNRGRGDSERKEDDVNLLDRNGLYEYIFSKYETLELKVASPPYKSDTDPNGHEYFTIPIFMKNFRSYRLNTSFDNGEITKIQLLSTTKDAEDFMDALRDNFYIWVTSDGRIDIKNKENHGVSNQLCMDVIKTIVENAPEPLLKKKEE